jgi:hypothetical protein
MTLPFALPDWVPWWVSIVVIVPVILFGLAFLFMPFSVFGVKGRLEGVEARLDEIQGEIRSLALRLPERVDRVERDMRPAPGPRRWADDARPPIPPAPYQREQAPIQREVEDRPPPPPTRRIDPARGSRAEPRFDPRSDPRER